MSWLKAHFSTHAPAPRPQVLAVAIMPSAGPGPSLRFAVDGAAIPDDAAAPGALAAAGSSAGAAEPLLIELHPGVLTAAVCPPPTAARRGARRRQAA